MIGLQYWSQDAFTNLFEAEDSKIFVYGMQYCSFENLFYSKAKVFIAQYSLHSESFSLSNASSLDGYSRGTELLKLRQGNTVSLASTVKAVRKHFQLSLTCHHGASPEAPWLEPTVPIACGAHMVFTGCQEQSWKRITLGSHSLAWKPILFYPCLYLGVNNKEDSG